MLPGLVMRPPSIVCQFSVFVLAMVTFTSTHKPNFTCDQSRRLRRRGGMKLSAHHGRVVTLCMGRGSGTYHMRTSLDACGDKKKGFWKYDCHQCYCCCSGGYAFHTTSLFTQDLHCSFRHVLRSFSPVSVHKLCSGLWLVGTSSPIFTAKASA